MSNSRRIGYALGRLAAVLVKTAGDLGDKAINKVDDALSEYGDKKMDSFLDAQHKAAMANKEYAEIDARTKGKESISLDDLIKQSDISNQTMPQPPIMELWRFLYARPIGSAKRQIRWAYQRLTRGWDDTATWSLDTHLAKTLGEQLKHLANTSHGYPSPEHETFEDWIADLNKNADALIAYGNKWDNNIDTIDEEADLLVEAQKAMHWVANHLPSLWD